MIEKKEFTKHTRLVMLLGLITGIFFGMFGFQMYILVTERRLLELPFSLFFMIVFIITLPIVVYKTEKVRNKLEKSFPNE